MSVCTAQEPLFKQQVKALDSIATQDVPPGAPGIATAIIQDGAVIYEKSSGYADLSDSSLISSTSRFNIASNGKQFTTLAVLLLLEEKKLQLSDDIRKFYPSLFANRKDKITIQNLLDHTSGIRDCYELWSLQGYTWWKESFSNADVLQLIQQQQDLNFTPGAQYLYSNTNYILLALIVEKVTGDSFVAFTNAMFRKLNMPNTSFESDYNKIRGPIARSYFNFGSWTTYQWKWNVCGDGNIFSTLADQVQWEKILQGKGTTAINAAVILKSQQPIPGSPFQNYGYGVEFGRYKNLDRVFHEGATGAWKAMVTRFPASNTSIITLTNSGKTIPSMQNNQVADQLFALGSDRSYLVTKPERVGAPVTDEEIIGTYLTEQDFVFTFAKKDTTMFLTRVGRNDVELERETGNIYHQKFDPPFKQEFTRDAKGNLQVTAYYTDHAPYSLTKQTDDLSGFNKQSLEGTYVNTETAATLSIRLDTNQSYLVSVGNSNDPSTALLVTPQKLLFDNYSLIFETATGGGITEVLLNGNRIKQVRFVKQGAVKTKKNGTQ